MDVSLVEAAVARLLKKDKGTVTPIWDKCADRETDCFCGWANPDRHRSTGNRAWCDCAEWCYPHPDLACACCREYVVTEHARREAALLLAVMRAHPVACDCSESLHAMDNRCYAAARLAREIVDKGDE